MIGATITRPDGEIILKHRGKGKRFGHGRGPTGHILEISASAIVADHNIVMISVYTGRMDDLDIYETALDLIKKYGREASVEAAMRSDRMLDRGDQHAVGQWNKVMQAVEELQSPGFRLRH